MEDVIIFIILMISGLLTGLLAGLFGIGGGTVLIPVFLTIFPAFGFNHELMMHIAVSTSLALIIPTAISSSYKHYQLGHMERNMIRRWIPGLIIGILCASVIIHLISPYVLKLFFTCYLLLCFIYEFFQDEEESEGSKLPGNILSGIISFFVGGLSTLLGTGGGTFTVPILAYLKYPMKKAIGVSALSGLFIGCIGASAIVIGSYHTPDLPRYSLGYVNLLAFVAVAPTAMLTSPWGAKLEDRLTKHQLNVSYMIFLLLTFSVMVYHVITG